MNIFSEKFCLPWTISLLGDVVIDRWMKFFCKIKMAAIEYMSLASQQTSLDFSYVAISSI